MSQLLLNQVPIHDTFAEAFGVTGTRLIITAINQRWAETAAREATGYGTSVIACDAEAGIESVLSPDETPDGRPGVSILLFAFNRDALGKAIVKRIGQCVLTCATTAVFDGCPETDKDRRLPLGKQLRYFGDGFQASKVIGEDRYWRIPVMEGEFLCADTVGSFKGVAGGNLLIGGRTVAAALAAAEAAVSAMDTIPGVITPFPGGIVRSGSKVGSRYPALRASSNDAHCPTLSPRTESHLRPETGAMFEIVIDGFDEGTVATAMRAGLRAAVDSDDVTEISAGNYGGKLGKHHFHLHALIDKL